MSASDMTAAVDPIKQYITQAGKIVNDDVLKQYFTSTFTTVPDLFLEIGDELYYSCNNRLQPIGLERLLNIYEQVYDGLILSIQKWARDNIRQLLNQGFEDPEYLNSLYARDPTEFLAMIRELFRLYWHNRIPIYHQARFKALWNAYIKFNPRENLSRASPEVQESLVFIQRHLILQETEDMEDIFRTMYHDNRDFFLKLGEEFDRLQPISYQQFGLGEGHVLFQTLFNTFRKVRWSLSGSSTEDGLLINSGDTDTTMYIDELGGNEKRRSRRSNRVSFRGPDRVNVVPHADPYASTSGSSILRVLALAIGFILLLLLIMFVSFYTRKKKRRG